MREMFHVVEDISNVSYMAYGDINKAHKLAKALANHHKCGFSVSWEIRK